VTLLEFDAQLRAVVGSDEEARPFVCDGSPLDCEAFIVGANPATAVPFWPYWDASYGFRKGDWLRDYERAREGRGKRGRSPTRSRIERIVRAALPVRCLETNVYAKPSASLAGLRRDDRQAHAFEFLLASVRPRVLLVHGEEARAYLRAARGVDLVVGRPSWLSVGGDRVRVLPTHHLAYQWSYERADEAGRWIAEEARRVVRPPEE